MDDYESILIEARRIGLSTTELDELTPKEFKAVRKGYALHLADQRQQILYGHSVPQVTVSGAEADSNALVDVFKKLSEQDIKNIEAVINEGQQTPEKLTTGNRQFIEAVQRLGKG